MSRSILFIDPFYGGSHKTWIDGIIKKSRHHVTVLGLEGRHWKWRMLGGAVPLAERFNDLDDMPDLIVASDMLDLNTFLSLTRKKSAKIPVALYFHENQLTYPWSERDRDRLLGSHRHFGLINYRSALAADMLLFNSEYHRESFLGALPSLLNTSPDYRCLDTIDELRTKSRVLYLGLGLERFEASRCNKYNAPPLLLWNHRWEYDKNPEQFLRVIYELDEKNLDFGLVLLGEVPAREPDILKEARQKLDHRIAFCGFTETFDEYASWLWRSHLLPVTSNQDFFGISIMEAAYCGVLPLLPKRLTYPELFSEKIFEELFYRDGLHLGELIEKNLQKEKPKLQEQLMTAARRYDWREIIGKYDELFEKLSK